MQASWYSNGKLMMTGEYMVLFGSVALAIPVKYGQSLEVIESPGNSSLTFTTDVLGKPWFEAEFYPNTLEIYETTNINNALFLQRLLRSARILNPEFLNKRLNYFVKANLNFNISWGLGSSSSLISNIAWWAEVDPFELNRLVSKGSGYDIACARSQTPVMFSLNQDIPHVESVRFQPLFSDHIWFVYLGQKQSTPASIQELLVNVNPAESETRIISDITYSFLNAKTLSEFSSLINQHETLISGILGIRPVQSLHFSDFDGTIKSLGAWGGDFCMAVSEKDENYIKLYFEQKGLKNVFSFKEMALTS